MKGQTFFLTEKPKLEPKPANTCKVLDSSPFIGLIRQTACSKISLLKSCLVAVGFS